MACWVDAVYDADDCLVCIYVFYLSSAAGHGLLN